MERHNLVLKFIQEELKLVKNSQIKNKGSLGDQHGKFTEGYLLPCIYKYVKGMHLHTNFE